MSTFISDLTSTIQSNTREVELLISKAKNNKAKDEDYYNSLCRAVIVLNIAHLEGFTKSLIRSIVHDLNRNLSFGNLPKMIQRTYCM
ncbi:MAG: HEPN domain-containing protein, partial [Spirochaetales bacterium]|nr:HEPN domain-containing protein [Spirochaetales bacterium]